jgi:hypothetical protein
MAGAIREVDRVGERRGTDGFDEQQAMCQKHALPHSAVQAACGFLQIFTQWLCCCA